MRLEYEMGAGIFSHHHLFNSQACNSRLIEDVPEHRRPFLLLELGTRVYAT